MDYVCIEEIINGVDCLGARNQDRHQKDMTKNEAPDRRSGALTTHLHLSRWFPTNYQATINK